MLRRKGKRGAASGIPIKSLIKGKVCGVLARGRRKVAEVVPNRVNPDRILPTASNEEEADRRRGRAEKKRERRKGLGPPTGNWGRG